MKPEASAREATPALRALAERASGCRECPLGYPATQTVWGEGPALAPLMLVGEQPGDQEDLRGRPFGHWLDCDHDGRPVLVMLHPSARLRLRSPDAAYAAWLDDLAHAAEHVPAPTPEPARG